MTMLKLFGAALIGCAAFAAAAPCVAVMAIAKAFRELEPVPPPDEASIDQLVAAYAPRMWAEIHQALAAAGAS